jgi:hypothetical protein
MIVCPDTKKEVSEETCRENRRVYREFNGRFNKPCASCGVVLPPRPKAVNAGRGNPAAARPGRAVAPGARGRAEGRNAGGTVGDRSRRPSSPGAGIGGRACGGDAPRSAPRTAQKAPGGGAAGPAGIPGRTLPGPPSDQAAQAAPAGVLERAAPKPAPERARAAEPDPAGISAPKRTRGKPPKCKCSVCFIAHCPNRRETRQFSRVPRLCTSCGQKHYRNGDQCRICARKGRQGRVAP